MTECLLCSGKAQLFLCQRCTDKLRSSLHGLARGHELSTGKRSPGWLEYLDDAATGQAKLGTGGHRRRGDDEPLRLNLKASRLLSEAHETLAYWVKDICDTRRVRWIPVRSVEFGFIGPLRQGWRRLTPAYQATTVDLAMWLADNVSAIASSEHADEIHLEILDLVERIEKTINRPKPPRFIGPCPTIVGPQQRECGNKLAAPRDAIEVTCGDCGEVFNVDQLSIRLFNSAHYLAFTIRELLDVVLPRSGDPVPRRTLYHWIKTEKLVAKRTRQPGEIGEGEPEYLLADVRRLRALTLSRRAAVPA